MNSPGGGRLVLVAMIFAVSMTFIDQTIVAIAVPELQKDLGLSETGVQWVINGYLLSLSALFAFGGRIGDIVGHRRILLVGVVVFATASALCGATPEGGGGEAWIITFRVIQGAGAALMFPAALAIVLQAFEIGERGKAMAIFFAFAGGLTAIGPLAGGYLVELDWRTIFWVNVPVALIALALTSKAKIPDDGVKAPLDWGGTALVSAGMALSVLGLQQSASWGWGDPATLGCLVAGIALLVVFVVYERRQEYPLIQMQIFSDRAFTVQNVLLFLLMIGFVPLFFFASTYAQISLGYSASEAGLYLLAFFGGFAVASQIGGRILDSRGARPAVVVGFVVAAVGFYLWARQLTDLEFSQQWHLIVLTGAGVGLVLSPSNTDALNRAPATAYGEATGITQTVRNYGASLGLAVLGSILITENRTNIEDSLGGLGIPKEKADEIALALSQSGGGSSGGFAEHAGHRAQEVFQAVQLDYALSMRTIFYAMAAVMVVGFVVSLVALPGGKPDAAEDPAAP